MKTVSYEQVQNEFAKMDKLHPIVRFFRYRFLNKYFWTNFWYTQVSSRIRPRNKWVNKVVPRTFTDKDYIYEEVLFAGLVDFWENDGGEETMRFQWEGEDVEEERRDAYQKVYNELKAAYEWALIRKSQYDGLGTCYKAEEKLIAEDDMHLANIIRLRKWMWS